MSVGRKRPDPGKSRAVRLTRRQVLLGTALTTLAPAWVAVDAAVGRRTATVGPAPDEAAISRVVPDGHLGEYRHGTYPSRGARTHVGVDIVAPCGTPIRAAAMGTIVDQIRSSSDPDFGSLGYMVIVEHPATLTGRAFYTLYLHLQS